MNLQEYTLHFKTVGDACCYSLLSQSVPADVSSGTATTAAKHIVVATLRLELDVWI